jgi:predicted patatin/cPLA2 family phospholipase
MTIGEYLHGLVSAPPDTKRPALVVQGGGLRAIYSMAALAALEDEGLRDAFSVVVGSSAGGINGAYFLAGQGNDAVKIYSEDLSGKRFVTPWRFWRIVDIDYMVDIALKVHLPLNIAAMRAAHAHLYVVLTDAETAKAKVIDMRDERVDPYEVFRATAALPSLYNKRVEVGDRRYIDGGIAKNVPLTASVGLDADEELVVLTRPLSYRRSGHGQAYRFVGRLSAVGHSASVKALIGAPDPAYNDVMEELEAQDLTQPQARWPVWPSDPSRLVERTTSDLALLRDCAAMAREDMKALLARPHAEVDSI